MLTAWLHTGTGVHITSSAIYWASFVQMSGYYVRQRCTSERVQGTDVEGALQRLVARVKPRHPYVTTHLDDIHLKHLFVKPPPFDDAEQQAAWVLAEVAQGVSPGLRRQDVVVRYKALPVDQGPPRGIIMLAHRSALEARVVLLRRAGLEPVGVGSALMGIGDVLAYHEAFLTGPTTVVFAQGEGCLLHYQNGRPQQIDFGRRTAAEANLLIQYRDQVQTRPPDEPAPRTWMVGEDVIAWIETSQGILHPTPGVPQVVLPPEGGRKPLPATHIAAAGLALHQVYPGLEAINLLPDHQVDVLRQDQERARSKGVIGRLLAGVVVLLSCLFGVNRYAVYNLNATQQLLLDAASEVEALEHTRANLEAMQEQLRQAEAMAAQRSKGALLLGRLGRTLPEGAWLLSVAMEAQDDDTWEVLMAGYVLPSADLGRFVGRLEKAPWVQQVDLIHTTLASGSARRGQAQTPMHFEVRVHTAPARP